MIKRTILFFSIIFLFLVNAISSEEPIIFVTLPKSGSMYISQTLSQGLNKTLQTISHNTFPHDPIIFSDFLNLVKINGITQEHIDASFENISLLKKLDVKIIVNVRDPRQTLISWTHHLNRHRNSPGVLSKSQPLPPEKYFFLSLSEQFDWQIENYLPLFIEWIEEWVLAKEQDYLDIKFTTYEHFNQHPESYYKEILEFYQIPYSNFSPPIIPKTLQYNYRNGTIDEWKSALTSEQQQKVNAMIPKKLFSLFNWEKY